MPLSSEAVSFGHAIFRAPDDKIAVVGTSHHEGYAKDGLALVSPIKRKGWRIHFTSSSMTVEECRAAIALVDSLPEEPPIIGVKP